ncbi:uncharacterized protein LOC134538401 isoform X2 [Bacillus rossius redtenbacheri]|uniref:uncharacterized protein LOC134538401 isoform X2 n=1 Tax=Bacillus rossius redtenbacheri TaxID=93214 RepID=UPI002FDCFD1A
MSQQVIKKKSEENGDTPDSTTDKKCDFAPKEDVLLQRADGRFYFGTIVKVDFALEKCLVKFGDNTDMWAPFSAVKKLSNSSSDLLCVICKKSQPNPDNDIINCHKCGRGYHQLCHQPNISNANTMPDAEWFCRRCLDNMPCKARENKQLKKECLRKTCSSVSGIPRSEVPRSDMPLQADKHKLPYDPDVLTWDAHHRVNFEQAYCYCGQNGEWYMQMLQCGQCRQWFHEKCVQCLQYPLYYGDRFYVFVCSLCNYGKEFVRRLEMKWVDIVHLALFNLTIFHAKKYYDLDSAVIPYVNTNWNSFQLPPKILDVSVEERRENILAVLTNNKNRFKCGREIKKRTTIWGLRMRVPPPAPCYNLPNIRPVNDEVLKERWIGIKRLKFLPPSLSLHCSSLVSGKCNITTSFLPNGHASMIKSSSAACAAKPQGNVINGLVPSEAGLKLLHISRPERPDAVFSSASKVCIKSPDYCSGFVKKSTPFSTANRSALKQALLRQKYPRERLLKRQRQRNRQRIKNCAVARKLLKIAIAKQKSLQELPPTPPSSSAPDTPQPASSTPSPATCSSGQVTALELEVTAAPVQPSTSLPVAPPVTPVDTSGDEASSRCTLDSFIPPPKDFEGKNNPFRNLPAFLSGPNGLNVTASLFSSSTQNVVNQRPITLPLPLAPVQTQPMVLRPTKRQLSEKDIRIDRNGEVKRRRCRRTRSRSSSTAVPGTASKTAAYHPARLDAGRSLRSTCKYGENEPSKLGGASVRRGPDDSLEYVLNGRRLRAAPRVETRTGDKKPAAQSVPVKTSPVKQNPVEVSIDELKSSVNIYFGAATRIASGEKFSIRGRRTLPGGRTQYLIEWEGPPT